MSENVKEGTPTDEEEDEEGATEDVTNTELLFTEGEDAESPPDDLPHDEDLDQEDTVTYDDPEDFDVEPLPELKEEDVEEETKKDDSDEDIEFLKHPKKTANDWGDAIELPPDGLSDKEESDTPSIHISQMEITTREKASEVAEQIILMLEQDVVEHFGMDLETLEKLGLREKVSGSSVSVGSSPSIPLPGEPSKLRLFYQKGSNLTKYKKIPPVKKGIDVMCEVALHRSRKWKKGQAPEYQEQGAQTRQMTFVPESKAQFIFMELYPKPDDWIPDEVPARKKSMEDAIALAEKEDPQVDRTRLKPQIVRFTNRKKILPPLRDDYYKDETFWTGSRFQGEFKNRQFAKGHYDHPTGVKYESEWKDGHFHSDKHTGIMEYPRGDTFEGTWVKGRYQKGEITFGDGLKYQSKNWSYLENNDRRLRVELYYGIKPAGETLYNDQYPLHKLQPGHYDVGYGTYDPKSREISGYDGFIQKVIKERSEHRWILKHCRKSLLPDEEYIPSFHPDRIPGSSMPHAHHHLNN